ncbi:MAG: DUF1674 domain-containing protein [Gammaproteobacteria bacterium]
MNTTEIFNKKSSHQPSQMEGHDTRIDVPMNPGDLCKRRSQLNSNEIGGPKGPEPTRYGDWERGGRAIDF